MPQKPDRPYDISFLDESAIMSTEQLRSYAKGLIDNYPLLTVVNEHQGSNGVICFETIQSADGHVYRASTIIKGRLREDSQDVKSKFIKRRVGSATTCPYFTSESPAVAFSG